MPNNRNRKNKNSQIYYNGHEHDDRVPFTSETTRRVSFKNYRQRGRDDKIRTALAMHDEDVEMMIGSSFGNYRRRPYSRGDMRRRGGRGGRGGTRGDSPGPMIRRLPESPLQWYKVLIPEGNKYDKSYLIGLIQSYIKPFTLVPYGYAIQEDSVYFYVDDYKIAQQILLADRKITTSDSWRLVIIVRANIPHVEVTEPLEALMKLTMSGRYNTNNKALDLTKFHADPVFVKHDIFCPLNRPPIMTAVLTIIGESVPDVVAINFSDNNITSVDTLKKLKTITTNLKILYLKRNNVKFMDQFDSLQGLQIEELDLDENPLCNKFRDKETYIREVQKRFPKVIKLDGTDVPRMITFDVEEETPLVPSVGVFMCSPAAADIVRSFLTEYYNLYDSDSRAPLAGAYHLEAQFSMACSHQNVTSSSMAPYLQDSRNLLVVNNLDKRKRLLKKGKDNIIAYLMSLPKTQHDPQSFTIDCSVFSPTIIMLSVSGVFREVGEKKYPMRSFHRSFVIVPFGSGFCIINEMLHITPATSDQVKAAFKSEPAPAQSAGPAAPVVPAAVAPVVPVVAGPSSAPVLDIITKQQMVTTFSAQSGMNLIYSEKCLSENNWDFNHAVFVFTQFHKEGKIPAEAFIK